VLLDYSKAFDTINHSLLLSVLHYIGLGDGAVTLFASYILGRTQRVFISGEYSDPEPVVSGVPQGSILGPILYTIYTSSLYDSLKYCQYHVYADDTQIYLSFNEDNVEESVQHINSDIQSLMCLSHRHSLSINPNKCSILLFGNRQIRERVKHKVVIQINNSNLPITESAKNLGIILDSDLRFKKHISTLTRKCFSILRLLFPSRHILSRETRALLCESLVLSNLNYCDVVYGPCLDSSDKNRVQRIQNSCIRFIYGVRRWSRVTHLLKPTGWLSMADRRSLHAACAFHKIIRTGVPQYLSRRVRYRTDVHNINIRRRDLLSIPRHRLEVYKRSFTYCISSIYNNLPAHLKSLSITSFKHKLKILLFEGQIHL